MGLNRLPVLESLLHNAGPKCFGTIVSVDGMSAKIAGLSGRVKLGDALIVKTSFGLEMRISIVAIDGALAIGFSYDRLTGVASGDIATLERASAFAFPCDGWLGLTLDPFGKTISGSPAPSGAEGIELEAPAPNASRRKLLGSRIATGLCVFDAFLPICVGQRIGLFAGSGVGKSILLGELAGQVDCDVAVVGLIGERGREVRAFVEEMMGAEARNRSVVIASTADQSPLAKKRGAHLAMATAEYFRNQGKRVLLVFDSLTRYAEAHREVALSAGEAPSLHAFPPSTFRAIASLVERAGPGEAEPYRIGQGDITAIFSVLVAGSDMDEPVADMIRGILDGHVVLDRKIAERGRFPAINVRRSVSRSLPKAASRQENELIRQGRRILGAYEEAETIVRAGLYADGSDPLVDEALKIWPALDDFFAGKDQGGPGHSFERLSEILNPASEQAPETAVKPAKTTTPAAHLIE